MAEEKQKTKGLNREVDPKLAKILMRVICGIVIAFAVFMLVFTLYAQTQLKDDSENQLNGNYVLDRRD